jgi:hypothetical protein
MLESVTKSNLLSRIPTEPNQAVINNLPLTKQTEAWNHWLNNLTRETESGTYESQADVETSSTRRWLQPYL